MDLCNAIKTESLDVIKALISKKGFTRNSKWLDYAALNSAIKYGRKDVVQVLLQNNCRVYKANDFDTPLHAAVQLADPQLVSDLLKRKASIVVVNEDNNSPLHVAFMHKQEKLIDLMLDSIEKNFNFVNQRNSQGLTHLHIACTRSNAKVIEGFLDNGASTEDLISNDSVSWAGYNAYHFAADFKSLTAIKVLSRRNDIGFYFACLQKNSLEMSPLDLINKHLEELSIMAGMMNIATFSPFHMACVGNDAKLLKRFLDNGANVDYPISNVDEKFCPSFSALHFAAKSSSSTNVQLLLNYGANANRRNNDEMTPVQSILYDEMSNDNNEIGRLLYNATDYKLHQNHDKNGLSFVHVACSRNDRTTVKQLLARGEDVNGKVTYERQQLYHYTPLHFAIKYEHLEMVKYLVQCGADVNLGEDCVDGTPLLLACKIGHLDIIDFLLENEADAKAIRPYDEKTAVHLFIDHCILGYSSFNHAATAYVPKLVKFGADVNAQDSKGNTVLHLVCDNIFDSMRYVNMLLNIGADINIENNAGCTPFDNQLSSSYIDMETEPGDYTILYHHVQKLKAIGFKVNPKNEACCERLFEQRRSGWDMNVLDFKNEELDRKEQQRIDEITRMKSIKLNNKVSLYDLIRLEPEQAKDFVTHDILMEIIQKEFPVYGYLLRLQHQKAVDIAEVKVEASNKRRAVKIESDSRHSLSKRRRSK